MRHHRGWRLSDFPDRTNSRDLRRGRAPIRRTVCLWACLLFALTACGEEEAPATISVKVFPARLAEEPSAAPQAGWRLVEYSGGVRAGAGSYLAAEKPLMTEWNLVAVKIASQPDGSAAVTGRLNAYAKRELSEFTADAETRRGYLAVQIDGRWADVSPLLRRITDRITIYGFTTAEAERLERYLTAR